MFWPRLQLLEIGDLSWCPSWLHQHKQFSLTKLWNLQVPFWNRGSLAIQGREVFEEHLQDYSSYTVLDICAGSGGPIPVLESELNKELEAQGKDPIQFILSDLHPHIEAWEQISKKQQNISYIETPVDARADSRIGNKKKCRVFSICFHQ
jgi:salicylate hydroxylase